LHQIGVTNKFLISMNSVSIAVSESLICVGICLALPALCSNSVNSRVLRCRSFASLIGGFSYTLYLTHYPTMNVLNLYLPQADRLSLSSVANFSIRASGALLVAAALYCLFERNTGVLRRHIRK